MRCERCGSYAINHHHHGRDGSDPNLCDVCYWRKRAESSFTALSALYKVARESYTKNTPHADTWNKAFKLSKSVLPNDKIDK